MPVTLGVVAAGLFAATAVTVWSRLTGAEPVEPEGTEEAVVEAAEQRPSLVRMIRRLPSRVAGSVFVAGALVVVFGLAVAAGALLDMVNAGSGLATFDEAVAAWGSANATRWSTLVLAGTTHLGSSVVAIVVLTFVGWLAWKRHQSIDVPLYLATIYVGHALISNGIKWIVERERPLVEHLVGTASSSFPSTHSGTAAATWAAVALVLGAGKPLSTRIVLAAGAAGVTALVAASRALLGVHWLTDVVAGVAIGWAWFVFVSVAFGGRILRLGEPADRVKEETAQAGVS